MTNAAAGQNPAPILQRWLDIRREEVPAVAWSFAYFFALLAGYYMLRSVRETMAIVSGVQNIPWLFTGTFVVTLLATPVFGWLTSRFPRRAFLPWVYYFFIANIALFYLAFTGLPDDSPALIWVARGFFVWLSVFNLFVVSVFWSFMADIYRKEQSRRLFGVISAGGSAGAFLGPLLTAKIVVVIGFENLLPIPASLLAFAVYCVYRLRRWARTATGEGSPQADSSKGLGGSALAGVRFTFTSPYFGAIAGGLLITNFLGGATYFYMADLVSQTFPDTNRQTQIFATLDAVTNLLSFLGQFLIVRLSVKKLGVGWTLSVLPIVSIIGFSLLAFSPVFVILATLQVIRRSVGFGLTKPTNDMLYAVVTPEEKYKAKNFIDTAVYRASDLVTAWSVRFLGGVIGLPGIAMICVPLALFWTTLTFWIGRQYERKDQADVDAQAS